MAHLSPPRYLARVEPPGDPFRAAIERYLAQLVWGTRASPHTVAAYRRDLAQLAAYVDHALPGARPADLDHVRLRAFLASLARTCGLSSLRRKLAAVRSFLRFLQAMKEVHENAALHLAVPKIGRPLPLVLDLEEVDEVLDAPDAGTVLGLRDRAMLETLYGAGLRVSELVSLDLGDVELVTRRGELGRVRVVGKGQKERTVPLGSAAVASLASYLERRPELRGRDGQRDRRALFLSYRGNRLGVRRVQVLVHLYGDFAARRPELHPHALRHTFAMHLLAGGAEVREIQRMLGHETAAPTQVYARVALDQLVDVYRSAHPLARRPM